MLSTAASSAALNCASVCCAVSPSESAREKLATFLVCLLERWKRLSGPSFNVALPLTRRDIADFLGLTIETVCRTLSTMAQEKILVIVPGGVRVLNLPRLEAIAAE